MKKVGNFTSREIERKEKSNPPTRRERVITHDKPPKAPTPKPKGRGR